MGQREILKFLEEQYKINPKKEFTSTEVASSLNKSPGSCSLLLKKLRRYNEVEYRKSNSRGRGFYYYKHTPEKDHDLSL